MTNAASIAATEVELRGSQEVAVLYHLSQTLASVTGEREMFQEVLATLAHELGMTRGLITLLRRDRQELYIEVGHDLPEAQRRKVRYRMGEGIVGRVVETGRPAAIERLSEEPMFLDRTGARRHLDKKDISFICVPIKIGNEVVGGLSADRVFGESASLSEDIRLLSIVASMIAQNVRNRREAEEQRRRLREENERLHHELEDRYRPENIIGNSGAMREVYRAIHQVAPADTTALIRGESGTGKELVASAIHYASPRAKGPFVKVNCAALPDQLIESELFGHEKGAFTGATASRQGRFETANGGTLFLDEVGDFAASTQVKLLRVLQEKEFERLGSSTPRRVNVRIVAATSRDLEQSMQNESFRPDLYYRLNVFPIFLPPLRDRKDDLMQLADHFVELYSRQMGKTIKRISTPAIDMLTAYHWPGNVREVENCIERAILLSDDGVIHGHHLPPTLQLPENATGQVGDSLEERMAAVEREILVDALKRVRGNMAEAARELKTTARIFRYKISKHGLDPTRYKTRSPRSV